MEVDVEVKAVVDATNVAEEKEPGEEGEENPSWADEEEDTPL